MAASWNLHILILFITIPLHYCQDQCQRTDRIKRETEFDITDDLLVNKVDRFIRSTSKYSNQAGDVVMIMDISGSLSDQDRENQRQTLKMLGGSNKINIGNDKVRIGIIAFETQAHMILHLDEGVTGQAVVDAAEKVNIWELTRWQFPLGTTNFPDAMNLAKKEFADNGRQGNIIKAALLVTDGMENCPPFLTKARYNCPLNKDCNEIADKCPRPAPPGDLCCEVKATNGRLFPCVKSAVFGEFRDLKSEDVTLAIIGVGSQVWRYGRDRGVCWATEGLYKETPSYAELEKTVEKLLTQLIPTKGAHDCQYKYEDMDRCHLDKRGSCGRNKKLVIIRNATGNGRPCPKEGIQWVYCQYRECNVTFSAGDYTPFQVLVMATTPSGDPSGVAWWVIFVILLAILAILLCLAILIIAIIRKKRVRHAVTSGVQPSLMQPVSGRPGYETPSQQRETTAPPGGITGVGTPTQQRVAPAPSGGITGAAVGRSIAKSQAGVSKSAQPSSGFLGSQQQKAGTMGTFHKVSMSKPISSQTTQERDTYAQPGRSLMPTRATKLRSFGKSASKKK